MTTEEFKAQILPHYRYMYRVAASVMKDDSEAADVVQDAMLKLYERRGQLDSIEDAKSYCAYVVRNACLNKARARKEHLAADDAADIDSREDIHETLACHDMENIVGRAMRLLPPDQRKAFELSAFGGFSNAEIAELLGISQGNARVLLSRARNKVKKFLSK